MNPQPRRRPLAHAAVTDTQIAAAIAPPPGLLARARAIPRVDALTVTEPKPGCSDMGHRRFPCDECPIRADNADNPKAKFPRRKWDDLTRTVPDGHGGASVPPGEIMFGCHKGDPKTGDDLACAGWLAVFGADHVGVRLSMFHGRLPYDAVRPGANWPPLHPDWATVRAYQTLKPGDSTDHLSGDVLALLDDDDPEDLDFEDLDLDDLGAALGAVGNAAAPLIDGARRVAITLGDHAVTRMTATVTRLTATTAPDTDDPNEER